LGKVTFGSSPGNDVHVTGYEMMDLGKVTSCAGVGKVTVVVVLESGKSVMDPEKGTVVGKTIADAGKLIDDDGPGNGDTSVSAEGSKAID